MRRPVAAVATPFCINQLLEKDLMAIYMTHLDFRVCVQSHVDPLSDSGWAGWEEAAGAEWSGRWG